MYNSGSETLWSRLPVHAFLLFLWKGDPTTCITQSRNTHILTNCKHMDRNIYDHVTSGNTYYIYVSIWLCSFFFFQVSPASLILPLSLCTPGEIRQDNVQSSCTYTDLHLLSWRETKHLRQSVPCRGMTEIRDEESPSSLQATHMHVYNV